MYIGLQDALPHHRCPHRARRLLPPLLALPLVGGSHCRPRDILGIDRCLLHRGVRCAPRPCWRRLRLQGRVALLVCPDRQCGQRALRLHRAMLRGMPFRARICVGDTGHLCDRASRGRGADCGVLLSGVHLLLLSRDMLSSTLGGRGRLGHRPLVRAAASWSSDRHGRICHVYIHHRAAGHLRLRRGRRHIHMRHLRRRALYLRRFCLFGSVRECHHSCVRGRGQVPPRADPCGFGHDLAVLLLHLVHGGRRVDVMRALRRRRILHLR
mmetsp:Transcript_55386/g.160822  ORF Transcript_55386/g.160822 Transcript_55386/m.160822 type:complete len:268 (+) Transcript_55386:580-1383(+)